MTLNDGFHSEWRTLQKMAGRHIYHMSCIAFEYTHRLNDNLIR